MKKIKKSYFGFRYQGMMSTTNLSHLAKTVIWPDSRKCVKLIFMGVIHTKPEIRH